MARPGSAPRTRSTWCPWMTTIGAPLRRGVRCSRQSSALPSSGSIDPLSRRLRERSSRPSTKRSTTMRVVHQPPTSSRTRPGETHPQRDGGHGRQPRGHRSLARRTVRPDGPPSARVTVRVGRAADRAGRPCGSLRQHGQQHPASRTSPSSRLARLGWRAGCTDRVPQLSSGHSRDAEARHASRGSRDDRPRLNSGICAPRPNRDRPSSVRGPVHPPKLSPFRGLGEVITRHPPMLSLLSRIEGSMTTTSGD